MSLESTVTKALLAEGFELPAGLVSQLHETLLETARAAGGGAVAEWMEIFRRHPSWRQFKRDWRLTAPVASPPPSVRERRRSDRTTQHRDEALAILFTVVVRRVLLITQVGQGRPATLLAEVETQMNAWVDREHDVLPAEELLDGYALMLTARVLLTGSQALGDFWLFREVAASCAEVRYPSAPRELRPILASQRPGQRAERIAGKQSSVRDIVSKTEEEQIKDILATELAPYHYSKAARFYVVDKIVNGGPLIVERYREDLPELRHRVLLTLIVNADPEKTKAHAVAAVLARRLAYKVITEIALVNRGTAVTIDVALFDQRDGEWFGVTFPLEQVRVWREPALCWCNVIAFDRLVPGFFTRWPEGATLTGGAVGVALPPSPFLHRESLRYRHDFYPVVTLRHRDEPWGGIEESIARLPNPTWIPVTRVDGMVDSTSERIAFRTLRSGPSWRVVAVDAMEGDEFDFAETVGDMVIGPRSVVAGGIPSL